MSGEKDISVASKQLKTILNDSSVSWKDKLSVLLVDSLYSQRNFLGEQVKSDNDLISLCKFLVIEEISYCFTPSEGTLFDSK